MESLLHGAEQGATFGFFDEAQGGLEALGQVAGLKGLGGPIKDWSLQSPNGFDRQAMAKAYLEARDRERKTAAEARATHPGLYTTGNVAGGIISPASKLGSMATLGKAAATGAAAGTVAGFGGSDADNMKDLAIDSAIGGTAGGILGAGGYGLMKGVEGGVNYAAPKVSAQAKKLGELLKLNKKSNAAEIEAAAKALGIKPTPGMLYDEPVLQGLESSLSQSPSIPGMLVRKSTGAVEKSLDDVASGALEDATSLSPFQVGERVKAGMEKEVQGRLAPSRAVFDELAESSADIAPNPKTLSRVANNIAKIDEVRLGKAGGQSWANNAMNYAEMLKNAKSVKDISTIRKLIGADLDAAKKDGGPARLVLGSLYDRATRLEEGSMLRGTMETMRGFAKNPAGKTGDSMADEGAALGRDLVSKMRGAKRDYGAEARSLRDLAGTARLRGVDSPNKFLSAVDDIRSENVTDKLFNVDDVNLMREMQTKFPEQAGLLRQSQLGDIKLRASTSDGALSTPGFFRQTKSLGDESKNILFGQDNVSKINSAKTVMQSLPEYIGPSGTPKGMEYLNMLDPVKFASDLGRYGLYKGRSADTTQKVADFLMRSPRFQKMAVENPKAFNGVVVHMAERFGTKTPLPMAAQNELDRDSSTPAQHYVSPDEAKKQFLEGN
jgi:hypothetical protein